MREMYNLTFVYLKNVVLLYFWIPDSVKREFNMDKNRCPQCRGQGNQKDG